MGIENRPDYKAAVIQLRADGLENLDETHRVEAERARCRIMALIAGGIVKRVVKIDTGFREPCHEEDSVS